MELDLKKLSEELLFLLTDYLKRDPQTLARITEIGEQLDREGGMRLMRQVGSMVQDQDLLKASWLNNAWDGIGSWMA